MEGKWNVYFKAITAKNTVISPNFLVWKFCGKAQFPYSFGRLARNYAETVFPQNFHTRKYGEINEELHLIFLFFRNILSQQPMVCFWVKINCSTRDHSLRNSPEKSLPPPPWHAHGKFCERCKWMIP